MEPDTPTNRRSPDIRSMVATNGRLRIRPRNHTTQNPRHNRKIYANPRPHQKSIPFNPKRKPATNTPTILGTPPNPTKTHPQRNHTNKPERNPTPLHNRNHTRTRGHRTHPPHQPRPRTSTTNIQTTRRQMATTTNGGGNQMKQNPGRPPKHPTTPTTSITLKIPATTKLQLINNADQYGMSLTEYFCMLVERDCEEG